MKIPQARFAVGWRLVLLASAALLWPAPQWAADDEGRARSEAEVRQREMREQAAGLTVRVTTGEGAVGAERLADPVLRYSDQQRQFPDATLWAWQLGGRPVAFSKIERLVSRDGNVGWQYCFAATTEDLIEASWPEGFRWKASQPGVRWQALPDAPAPHESEAGRLFQIKSLARQFAARIENPMLRDVEQMRLLPNPLLRYSSPDEGVRDGAVLGLTSKGTNPDTLLLFELYEPEDGPAWRYAVVGMTGDAVTVTRGGRPVWAKAVTREPGDHRNWVWYVDAAGRAVNRSRSLPNERTAR